MSATGFSQSIDRRVLGGFVFIDAITSASVVDPLPVTSTQMQVRANRSGVYAIFDAPGFTGLTSLFNPPPGQWQPGKNFEVTVQDPSLRYLARRAQILAPQALATLFNPQPVHLYPSPSAEVAPNWAVVRASVTQSNGNGVPWAVVQVIKSDNTVAATGMTDLRGEALLAVMGLGVQVSAGSSGSVTEMTIPVTVQAWIDPSLVNPPPGYIPNPDDILTRLADPSLKTGKTTGALGATQVLFAAITISV